MTDLAERGSLGVREFQPPFRLGLEDTNFGGQIFVPRQQLLIHHASNVSQDAHPIHLPSALANSRLKCSKNRSQHRSTTLRRDYTTHSLFYSFDFLTKRAFRRVRPDSRWRSPYAMHARPMRGSIRG